MITARAAALPKLHPLLGTDSTSVLAIAETPASGNWRASGGIGLPPLMRQAKKGGEGDS